MKAQEFRPGVDHVTQVMKVEQTIVGNRKPVSIHDSEILPKGKKNNTLVNIQKIVQDQYDFGCSL